MEPVTQYAASVQAIQHVNFLYLIPLFPLIGAAINGILGKQIQDKFGKGANTAIAVGAMLAAAAVGCFAFFGKIVPAPAGGRVLHDLVFPMISIGSLEANFALSMDQLSGVMVLIITLIGTGIHIYASGYMATEKAYWRFFCYLNLFVFAMLLLVLGDTFLLMFFGWEGVGLCSYLLIGFWYTDFRKATAGMKAFVVNRVGDFAFIAGLMALFWGMGGSWDKGQYLDQINDKPQFVQALRLDPGAHEGHEGGHEGAEGGEHGKAEAHEGHESKPEMIDVRVGPTMSFQELRAQLALTDTTAGEGEEARPIAKAFAAKTILGMPLVFFVCLCFFIGACGKSAQIPLYVWLPDAMAGPTPVSALIHAATMVTAGVYMIVRLNFLFWLSPGAMSIVALVGAMTALFAATMGLFQYDIKKVLAYSTVSQLGFMFLGVGVGAWWAGAFHLLTHACFKACLFLGSGSVIHGMHYVHDLHHGKAPPDPRLAPDPGDPQDMRNMGGLKSLMPATHLTYLIACISIAGFPIAAGFYSKDEILWKAMSNGATLVPGPLLWTLGFLAAGCTSFYMFRSYYMTFHYRAPSEDMKKHVHESPISMTAVLWILAVLAVVTGALGLPMLWTHAEPFYEQWLHPITNLAPFRAYIESHALEGGLMAASVGIATGGWLLARHFYKDAAASEARLEALKAQYAGWHRLLYNKYFVDEIYAAYIVKPFMAIARGFAWLDKNVVDYAIVSFSAGAKGVSALNGWIDRTFVDGAVNGVANVIVKLGKQGRKIQTGRVNNYVYGVLVGVVALFLITSWVK